MRPKIVAANWKMHTTLPEGLQLTSELIQALQKLDLAGVQVILLPPFTHLAAISQLLPTSGDIHLGAQNCHTEAQGAFTGEVAAPMLRAVGTRFVLIGHSERRQHGGEDSALLAQKVTAALAHGLRPIFCCGETQRGRTPGQSEAFVTQQLQDGLFHLDGSQLAQAVIAYEPVWAIGTDHTPSPAQVQAMHQAIRRAIALHYKEEIAQSLPILYGGSCNAQNAAALFACPDVDGGLVGRASLAIQSFTKIVHSLAWSSHE